MSRSNVTADDTSPMGGGADGVFELNDKISFGTAMMRILIAALAARLVLFNGVFGSDYAMYMEK